MRFRKRSRPRRIAGAAPSKLTGWRHRTQGSVLASPRWPRSRTRRLRSATGPPLRDTRGRRIPRGPSCPTSCSPGPAAAVLGRCGRALMPRSRRSTVPVVEPTWSRWQKRTSCSLRLPTHSLARSSARTAPAACCLARSAAAPDAARVGDDVGQAGLGGTSSRRCPARFHISPGSFESLGAASAGSFSAAACSIIA
jgi:hypothetical protein